MVNTADLGRRRFIKLAATGLAAAPVVAALRSGNARAADMVDESDPAAVALKYKSDATKAPERKNPAAYCQSCAYYTGKPDGSSGPCGLLGGKLVSAKGWCTSWEGS